MAEAEEIVLTNLFDKTSQWFHPWKSRSDRTVTNYCNRHDLTPFARLGLGELNTEFAVHDGSSSGATTRVWYAVALGGFRPSHYPSGYEPLRCRSDRSNEKHQYRRVGLFTVFLKSCQSRAAALDTQSTKQPHGS